MPAFDASAATQTRKYGANDNALPPLGKIQLLPSSLSSQEQDLVHGNVKRDITGDVTYTLTGNQTNNTKGDVTDTIVGNHTYTLTKNLDHTVQGNTTASILGNHVTSNVGQVTNLNVGTVTRNFQAPTIEIHPEIWFQSVKNSFQSKPFNHTIGWTKIDLYGFVVAVNAAKVSLENVTFKTGKAYLNAHPGVQAKMTNIKTEITTTASKMVCTALLIGVLSLGTPFKPNALPRPTPITPFD